MDDCDVQPVYDMTDTRVDASGVTSHYRKYDACSYSVAKTVNNSAPHDAEPLKDCISICYYEVHLDFVINLNLF